MQLSSELAIKRYDSSTFRDTSGINSDHRAFGLGGLLVAANYTCYGDVLVRHLEQPTGIVYKAGGRRDVRTSIFSWLTINLSFGILMQGSSYHGLTTDATTGTT